MRSSTSSSDTMLAALATPAAPARAEPGRPFKPAAVGIRPSVPTPASQRAVAARQIPAGPWGRTWLLSAALFVAVLGGWEGLWRGCGFQPSKSNDEALWSLARQRLARSTGWPIVLIGTSRIQCAIDLDELATCCPGAEPIQLAIIRSCPRPILHDLAEDQSFAGLVVCDVTPLTFFRVEGPEVEESHRYLARYYRYLSPAERVERRLQLAVEDVFVFRLDYHLSPLRLAELLRARTWPEVNLARVRYDRMLVLRYPPAYASRAAATQEFKPNPHLADGAALEELLTAVQADVEQIRARGGQVVFVVLPSSGIYRDKERQLVPRERYWEVLLTRTGAPGIHFEDTPGMNAFFCPDGCHLDSRDAPAFTRALLAALTPHLAGTPWETCTASQQPPLATGVSGRAKPAYCAARRQPRAAAWQKQVHAEGGAVDRVGEET